jgi:putative proteasome-type protease
MTKEGLVLASDSRTNAGFDQVNSCRKMHLFVKPGERVFVILCSGSLSISQSVITLLRDDFDAGRGLGVANSLYDAARIVGDCVRRVSDMDRSSLERDSYSFNVHLLLGGQVRGQDPNLYLIYPQGNPLAATEDSLYLQLGECKYGRPILDRGIQASTSLEVAAKYALLSLDATMRSNVTVGPPFDLLLYKRNTLQIERYRRISAHDPDLALIHSSWEQSLRRAVEKLPDIDFDSADKNSQLPPLNSSAIPTPYNSAARNTPTPRTNDATPTRIADAIPPRTNDAPQNLLHPVVADRPPDRHHVDQSPQDPKSKDH